MWFKKEKGLQSVTKREVPNGLWLKCNSCNEILYRKELSKNYWVCENCSYHFKIPARKYIALLTDEFVESADVITSSDPLGFKEYKEKLKETEETTGLKEAIITGEASIGVHKVCLGVMDFRFMGGSMGSVVGEYVKRLIEQAETQKIPLIIVSASGGARMQEGILSLMQLAKTSASLAQLSMPYISVLTNPTTAGVMASYASLGNIILAEPKALLGFAGPRVIQQTIKQELPAGFQSSEFLLEHGLIDAVVSRKEIKETIIKIIDFFKN